MSPAYPLIHEIQQKAEKTMTAITNLNVDHYPFLKDHCFNEKIYIPAAVYMEILSEVCQCLFSSYTIYTIDKMEFKTLVVLPEQETLFITTYIETASKESRNNENQVLLKGECSYDIILPRGKGKRKKQILSCTITMMDQSKKGITSTLPDIRNKIELLSPLVFSDFSLQHDEIYPKLVHLGKSFNHIGQVHSLSPSKGIGAIVHFNSNETLLGKLDFNPMEDSSHLGNMFIRDSFFHIPSIWGNYCKGGFNIPTAFSGVHFYRKPNRKEIYYGWAYPQWPNFTDDTGCYSLLIMNSKACPVEYYEAITFSHALKIEDRNSKYDLQKDGSIIKTLGNLANSIKQSLPYSGIIPIGVIKTLTPLLFNLLTAEELAIYHKYKRSIAAYQFLGGRILLKILIRGLLKDQNDDQTYFIPYEDINIAREANGAPKAIINGKPVNNMEITVSHTKDYVFAGASFKQSFALDVEAISDRVLKVQDKLMDEEECKIILNYHQNQQSLQGLNNTQSNSDDDWTTLITYVWCAKEIITKIHRDSLMVILSQAKVKSIEKDKMVLRFIQNDQEYWYQVRKWELNKHLFCFGESLGG